MVEREIEHFDAMTDDGSYRTTVICYQEYIGMDESGGAIEGMRRAETAEGYTCEPIDDDTWQVVELGLIVYRVN